MIWSRQLQCKKEDLKSELLKLSFPDDQAIQTQALKLVQCVVALMPTFQGPIVKLSIGGDTSINNEMLHVVFQAPAK